LRNTFKTSNKLNKIGLKRQNLHIYKDGRLNRSKILKNN